MCGIAGTYAWRALNVDEMVEKLRHRGPDAQGVVTAGDAVHGHARLSLVDLSSASDQPFLYEGGVLTFAGEIWNHKALRADLEAEGVRFQTTGDTEVLAACLHHYGVPGALKRLEGMFAFAWSDRAGRHALVRDRFGKVPLYVVRKGHRFAWMSERKAAPHLSSCAIALPPGSRLDLSTGKLFRWYEPAGAEHGSILEELEAAVAERLAADAPVCCLISGGLDSSLVISIAAQQVGARNVTAFTAVLDPRSSDLKAARRLCSDLGVKLIEVDASATDRESFVRAAAAIEIGSKAQVEIAALCLPLAEAIAAEGFKACLSGEGADEIFGGYGNMIIKAHRADDAAWREIRLAAIRKMSRGNFVRCNKAFFAHGVEARLPFLRRELVEASLAMDKEQCPPGKGALKAAARRHGLPNWVVDRRKETFQGAAGSSARLADLVADPAAFIRAEVRRQFSTLAME